MLLPLTQVRDLEEEASEAVTRAYVSQLSIHSRTHDD